MLQNLEEREILTVSLHDIALRRATNTRNLLKRQMAERGGFEPPVEVSPYDGLANRCFRPLSHLSVR